MYSSPAPNTNIWNFEHLPLFPSKSRCLVWASQLTLTLSKFLFHFADLKSKMPNAFTFIFYEENSFTNKVDRFYRLKLIPPLTPLLFKCKISYIICEA